MPQIVVTTVGGKEYTFNTTHWRRRWEPTDKQLHEVSNDDDDVARLAHIEARHVLVIVNDDGEMLAMFNEWQCFRMIGP